MPSTRSFTKAVLLWIAALRLVGLITLSIHRLSTDHLLLQGGWSQVAAEKVSSRETNEFVVAVDLLPMEGLWSNCCIETRAHALKRFAFRYPRRRDFTRRFHRAQDARKYPRSVEGTARRCCLLGHGAFVYRSSCCGPRAVNGAYAKFKVSLPT